MRVRPRWLGTALAAFVAALALGCGAEGLNAPPEDEPVLVVDEPSDDEPTTDGEPESNVPDTPEQLPDEGSETHSIPEAQVSSRPPKPTEEEDGKFIAHEWGTFTSVVGSDGSYLPGLHHEEESLPAFVHQFKYKGVGKTRFTKGVPIRYLPEPVTQKLETPVIYFYTDKPREVTVDVKFPKGYISEWYPQAAQRSPKVQRGTCTRCDDVKLSKFGLDELADGRMKWKVNVSNQKKDLIDVPEDDIWAPSRKVPKAAYVDKGFGKGGEAEKFIFYRGVGQFEPPFRVRANGKRPGELSFSFKNNSDQCVPAIYLMDIREDRGRIVELSALDSGASTTFQPAPKESPHPRFQPMPKEKFMEVAKREVRRGLVESGLRKPEAEAMVETWERSYFKRTGWRVLYVLPRKWTDDMLPIDIKPKPDELVRTLVGRVEVLTPATEQQTLERVRRAYRKGQSLAEIFKRRRFEEPRFRRACQIADDPGLATWCKKQVSKLAKQVIYEARDAN